MEITKIGCIILFSFITSCSNNESAKTNSEVSDTSTILSASPKNDTPTHKIEIVTKPVKYSIIRNPTDGGGVFDFMYIVYVPKKINRSEAQWIFDDIISKKGGGKIAIDVWDSKKAFYEELKAYQKEDDPNTGGDDLMEAARQRRIITERDDIHNIASYTNNGVNISSSFPEDK